jgi:hypothetical protein
MLPPLSLYLLSAPRKEAEHSHTHITSLPKQWLLYSQKILAKTKTKSGRKQNKQSQKQKAQIMPLCLLLFHRF